MKRLGIPLVLIIALVACNGDDSKPAGVATASPSAAAAPSALTPEQLGEIGAQIRKDPARAEEILSARGLTQQSFEKQIRDITENPDASKRYAAAYRKASA